MIDKTILIGHLFKEQLKAYGDAGNVRVLKTRLLERGIGCEVRELAIGDEIDFEELDIIVLGGGRGRETRMVVDYLRQERQELKNYIEDGGVLLATGTALSILGCVRYKDGEELPGLELIEMEAERQEEPEGGNVVLEAHIEGRKIPIVGFLENKYLETHQLTPLGRIVKGAAPRPEGLIYKHLLATGLYGPVLAKNRDLADLLLKWALEKKYGRIRLRSLDDHLEQRYKKKLGL